MRKQIVADVFLHPIPTYHRSRGALEDFHLACIHKREGDGLDQRSIRAIPADIESVIDSTCPPAR